MATNKTTEGNKSPSIKLIGIHGKIQHGKDYAANILFDYFATEASFDPSPRPSVALEVTDSNEGGSTRPVVGYVRIDKFGNYVKHFISRLLNINYEDMMSQVSKNKIYEYIAPNYTNAINYLLDEMKMSKICYVSVSKAITKFNNYFLTKERLSLGEILQYIGTDCMRYIVSDTIWIDCLMNNWVMMGKPLTIIPDCRFHNEIQAIKSNSGIYFKVERLDTVNISTTRNQNHPSETSLDNFHMDVIHNTMDDNFKTRIISYVENHIQLCCQSLSK